MPFDATRYANEYQKKNFDKFSVLVKKGKKEEIRQRSGELGLTVSGYFQKLVEKDLNGEINWE